MNIGVLIFFQISISISIFNFFLFLFFYLFLQRGREGEREGEKHQCVVASHITTTGDLAGNPGDPWVWRPALDPLSHTSQGHFKFFEVSPYCFPQWLLQSAFPLTVQKCSPFSTSLPALVVCWFNDNSHSDWCRVIHYCGFNLHFSDD